MKKKVIIGVLIVVLLVSSIILGFVMSQNKTKDIEAFIVLKETGKSYDTLFIKTYEEYNETLKKYNALGKLTASDFTENDYLIDFIPYKKNMSIKNISVELGEKIKIDYEVNLELKDNDKLLINFIPLKKGLLSEIRPVEQSIKVSK
ncbi:MAG: hypothetical protein RSF02_00365 [Bacilli bacterium]